MKQIIMSSLLLCCLLTFSSCTERNSLEDAGERVDDVVDNVKDGDPILEKRGPIEKAGDAIEDTLDGDK